MIRSPLLWFTVSFFLCSLAILHCNAAEDELIVEIVNSTFDGFIQDEDMVVIEFYAPWCVHCHELEPTFLQVAKNLKSEGVLFGKVDIDKEKPLQERFKVLALPTVLMFRKGIVYNYAGPLGNSGADELTKYFLEEKKKDYLGENPIIELTDENFDRIVSSAETIFIEFFITECLKCKQLLPVFTAAARRLHNHTPRILFGTLDVPKNMDTAKEVGIEEYPLFLVYRYGKRYEFSGEETEEGMVSYLKREAGPASTYLEDLEAVKRFTKSPSEPVAVGFFSSESSATVVESFIETGNLVRQDMKLAHTTDERIAKQMKFQIDSVIVYHPKVLVSKYETGYNEIPNIENESSEDLARDLLHAARPLVGQVTLDNFGSIYAHRPLLVAYYDVDWSRDGSPATLYWHGMIADVAKDYRSTELEFAIAKENEFSQDLKSLGLAEWGEDVAVGLFAPNSKKYRMTEELDRDSLREFIDDFLSDSLEPYLLSELAPRKGLGPVRTVVGSTFSDIVYDSTKNVVIKLCIPSIHECHEAEKWYFRAASEYKQQKDIVFGEINVELNDVSISKKKFKDLPAILFSPKGSVGEDDLVTVTPTPEDDRDLTMWLRQEFNIKKTIKQPKNEL